ncbi:MAG: 50S ribosomal protein L18 [Candidatus Berkelbacteria bacterium]
MILNNKEKRIKRVRAKITGTAERPRMSVFRSNRQIEVQLIDDTKGATLACVTSLSLKEKATPVEKAKKVGALIAKAAEDKKIKAVVFDRRDKQYHGRVKAVAESARENGLVI